MTIHRPQDFVEVYRLKARAKDIHELTGRSGRPEQTKFAVDQIVSKLAFQKDDVLVDIGCGDGSLLRRICDGGVRSATGLVPTEDELLRLQHAWPELARGRVEIKQGLSVKTELPNAFATKVVINGVLSTLEDEQAVDATLDEIRRISRPEGIVYIGEIPERNEFAGRGYEDSISKWLMWTLWHRGLGAFWRGLNETLRGLFTSYPFVIVPKRMFWMERNRFITKLRAHGFEVLEVYRHREFRGKVSRESLNRWNYLALRPGDGSVRHLITASQGNERDAHCSNQYHQPSLRRSGCDVSTAAALPGAVGGV